METKRLPVSEWRRLTDDEQRARIRDAIVTDLDQLSPEARAVVDEMLAQPIDS